MPLRARLKSALLVLALATATSATAAPFSITHTGQIAGSGFSTVYAEQDFTVTLVFDNGNTTAIEQTWEAEDLTCILWRFNTTQNVVYAQNLAQTPPTVSVGNVHAGATGTLDAVFRDLQGVLVAPGSYTSGGFVPQLDFVSWYINELDPMFVNDNDDPIPPDVQAVGPGVPTLPDRWSNPVPFAGECAATTTTTPETVVANVPALGPVGLVLMAGVLGVAGWVRRRG